jgi:hypothetical protein
MDNLELYYLIKLLKRRVALADPGTYRDRLEELLGRAESNQSNPDDIIYEGILLLETKHVNNPPKRRAA